MKLIKAWLQKILKYNEIIEDLQVRVAYERNWDVCLLFIEACRYHQFISNNNWRISYLRANIRRTCE